jgi:hypothetical protein
MLDERQMDAELDDDQKDGELNADNIITFTPRADLDARGNLDGFIDVCRNVLRVFGNSLDFNSNSWDITTTLKLKGKEHKQYANFSNLETADKKGKWEPMREPFLSFAKSYFRYQHGLRPTKSFGFRLAALRVLEHALIESATSADPTLLNDHMFERAGQLIAQRYFAKTAYRIATQLEMIGEMVTANRLTALPIRWQHSLSREPNPGRVGKEFDDARAAKLPSKAALEAIPQIFHLANNPTDIIVSSGLAIMCSSPDRINELLSLPYYCEANQWNPDKQKDDYGLRWWPAKGADPMVKWILPSMADVVRAAIEKLRKQTDAARAVAKWYEENRSDIYLPPELESLRHQEWITAEDVGLIVFGDEGTGKKGIAWLQTQKIGQSQRKYRFADVERAVIDMLPEGFPIMPGTDSLKYSDALMVVLLNQMHSAKGTYACMVQPITIGSITNTLGREVQESIFDRYGFFEEDGSRIKLASHQLRHYLNTLAQAGGLSQLDIAMWSGRKDLRQNADYDHVTGMQIVQQIREKVASADAAFGTLAKISKAIPIRRSEFDVLEYQTAHTTPYGHCTHDFSMSPCPQHSDHLNCGSHQCVKGDCERNDEVRRAKAETEKLLAMAEAALGDEYDGADRWVEHHRMTHERVSQICEILDDPSVPNGAIIKFVPEHAPSRTRMVTEDHTVVLGTAAQTKGRYVAYLPDTIAEE